MFGQQGSVEALANGGRGELATAVALQAEEEEEEKEEEEEEDGTR